jgi:hypothetical protein
MTIYQSPRTALLYTTPGIQVKAMPQFDLSPRYVPNLLVFVCFPLLVWTASIPMENMTLSVPHGTSQHGDPHLLCVPTEAEDVLNFFLANYIAHAATVRIYPGESWTEVVGAILGAILLPTSGLVRGITAILRRGYSGTTPLEVAARSGALCMVVRSNNWMPLNGTRLSQFTVKRCEPEQESRWPSSYVYAPHCKSRSSDIVS